MTFGARVKARREELGMTQEELAHKLGYKSKTSINKIELDKRNLKQSQIVNLADALQTTPGDLLGWTERTEGCADKEDTTVTFVAEPAVSYKLDASRTRRAVRIPVLGRVAAGIPLEAVEDVIDWEEIPAAWSKQGDFVALQIHGDSMEPKMSEGDVVIVRVQPDVESGDVAIVRVNGNDATCKRVIKNADGITLVGLNPNFQPIFYSNSDIENLPVEIAGKVVELRAKF